MTAVVRARVRRRLVAAVVLAALLGLMLDYQVGPGFCSPEDHSPVRSR